MRKRIIATFTLLATICPTITVFAQKEGVRNVEVVKDVAYGEITEFDYEIFADKVLLESFNGKNKIVEIKPSYNIDGINYQTDLSEFQVGIGNNTMDTIIFGEGITEIPNNIFNSSDIKKVYFPKTMTVVYDKALSYLHPDEGELIQIYYGGTQDEWAQIFTEYQRTKVEDAEFGEELGTALADKLNEMMGSSYDSSEFEYFFSATPDDLKE